MITSPKYCVCKVDITDWKKVGFFPRLKPGSYLEIDARHAADGAVPPASGGEEVVWAEVDPVVCVPWLFPVEVVTCESKCKS